MWRPPQLGCAGRAASRRCSLFVSASRGHAVVQQRAAPQLPDPYLFASIKGCGSLDQCASLLDTHADRLSAMLICTLAIQTVQLCGRQPQAQLGPYSSDGGHRRDGSSSSSSSRSRQRDFQLLEQEQRQRYCTRLARLSTKRLGEFRPQQMSSLLWAFARLGYVPAPTWVSRFLGTVERALVDFPPGRLSQLIWALARLGITPASSFLNSFLAESLDKFHSSSPRDLSNTLWALAQMQVVVPPDYLTTAMAAAQQQWAAFQVHELCVFAWGLAKQPASLGAVTRQWVGDLVTQAGVLVPQGSGREAGMLLWALARWKGVVDPWQLDHVVYPTLQVLAREVAGIEKLAIGHVPAQQQRWSSNSRIHHPQQQQKQQQQEQAVGSSGSQGMSPGSTLQQPAWQPQSLASASYYSQLQQAQGAHQAVAAVEGTCHAAAVALSALATLSWRPRVHQEQQQALLLEVVGRLAHHAQQLRHVATLWWSVAALGLRPPPQVVAALEQQSLQFMQQQQQQQQQQRQLQALQQQQQERCSSAAAAGPTAANSSSSSSSSVVALGDILQLLLACARLKWRPSDVWWQTCYTLLVSGHASAGHNQQKLRRPLLLEARADQLAQLVSCIAAVKGPPPPPQVWQRLFERYEQVTQNISYWRRSGTLTAAAGSSASSSVTDTLVGHQWTASGLEQEQEEEAEAAAAISQMSMEEADFVLAVAGHMQQQEQEQEAGNPAAMGAATATSRAGQTAGVAQQHSRTSSMQTSSQQQEVSTGGLPGKSIVWLLWACAKHGVVPPSRLMVALLQQLLRKLPELGMAPCAALAWALRQLCCLGLRQKVPCTRLLCVVVLGVALRGKRLLRGMLPPSSSSSSSSRHGARALPAEAQRLQKQLLALVAVGGLRRPLQQLLERRKRYMELNRHRLQRGLPPLSGAQLQKGLLLAWYGYSRACGACPGAGIARIGCGGCAPVVPPCSWFCCMRTV